MFASASSLNCDLSKWDVSRVIDMEDMFASASSFNADLSEWDVSRVTSMLAMFLSASSFNGDISKWDVSRVTNMYAMFYSSSSFKRTLCGKWATSTAKKDQMFDRSGGQLCAFASKATSIKTLTLTLSNHNPQIPFGSRTHTKLWQPFIGSSKVVFAYG